MSRVGLLNGLGLVVALCVSALGVEVLPADEGAAADSARISALRDATGALVPTRRYARIVSASTVADQALLALLEPSRIVALSDYGARNSTTPWRYEPFARVMRLEDIEAILALRPDLVIAGNVGDPRPVARLREAGVAVFDLGPMQGFDTMLDDLRAVGTLTAIPERADTLAARLEARMRRVAAGLSPERPRLRALYLGPYGSALYGGTAGTNYHDVLVAAGLVDVAAEAGHQGWPAYAPEELLALAPPWIVTTTSRATSLCQHPVVRELEACREGRILAVDDALLADPGLGMLEAAEALHEAAYADR